MKDVKEMSYEELLAIWEKELLVAAIDPYEPIPIEVVEVLYELEERDKIEYCKKHPNIKKEDLY